jgi:hypothetical protein
MSRQPQHRPRREFPDAPRIILEPELEKCIHCAEPLAKRVPWHMRKTIQTLEGPLFVAGKSRACVNRQCSHRGTVYYASRVWLYSLPFSTYGLDVLAYIGWRHEHEHRRLVEIQRELNERGVAINERNVGKLYRQFLALLGGTDEQKQAKLAEAATQHGGLIWAIDGLKPEGHGTLLFVLYEVLSATPVAAIQLAGANEEQLCRWLKPYQAMPYPVLATLSDGEKGIIAALKTTWPQAPHQRCQAHFLNNLAEPVMVHDAALRQGLRDALGYVASPPEAMGEEGDEATPPF